MPVSLSIRHVIRRATTEGNAIANVSTGWSRVREVTYMAKAIDDTLWAALHAEEPSLRPWIVEATPHDRAERGLTDDQTGEAICFPR